MNYPIRTTRAGATARAAARAAEIGAGMTSPRRTTVHLARMEKIAAVADCAALHARAIRDGLT